jgi:hypothetical protein
MINNRMGDLKNLSKSCPEGIPFSMCRELLTRKKKTAKKIKSSSRKKRKVRTKRRIVPPKGVVIRKKGKLYRSNGRTLKPL